MHRSWRKQRAFSVATHGLSSQDYARFLLRRKCYPRIERSLLGDFSQLPYCISQAHTDLGTSRPLATDKHTCRFTMALRSFAKHLPYRRQIQTIYARALRGSCAEAAATCKKMTLCPSILRSYKRPLQIKRPAKDRMSTAPMQSPGLMPLRLQSTRCEVTAMHKAA